MKKTSRIYLKVQTFNFRYFKFSHIKLYLDSLGGTFISRLGYLLYACKYIQIYTYVSRVNYLYCTHTRTFLRVKETQMLINNFNICIKNMQCIYYFIMKIPNWKY